VDVALSQPPILLLSVNPSNDSAHHPVCVLNEAMASGQFTVGGDTEVSRARTARIGPVRTTMDFMQRIHDIRERIAFTTNRATFKFNATLHHCFQQSRKIRRRELTMPSRRPQDW
jgi:hypothetical protein